MAIRNGIAESKKIIGVLLLGASFAAFASNSAMADESVKERIKPIGKLYLKGSEQVTAAVDVVKEPRSGESVYTTYCTACHATGVTGAPITGSADEWAPRLSQGMETLMKHAINGFNAMPARGTCMDCSDDEIQAAIDHMLKDV